MNFLYHLNLNKAAEIQNALLHRVTGSGLLDTVAQIAFDTIVSHPKIFDGTAVRTFILSNDVLDDVTISGSSSTQVVSQNATKTFVSSSIATIANTSLTLSGSANHILINGDVSSSLNLTQNRTFILSLPSTVNLSNLSVSGNLHLSGVQNITTSSLNFLISSGSEYVTKTISGSELVNLIGLSNVENITLSTWTGSVNLIKVGTITEGEWNGTDIDDTYISSSNVWHGKQDALTGSGFVKSSVGNITYDTNTYLTTISGIVAGGELSGSYPSPSLVNNAVVTKILSGYNTLGGVITSSDSILTAFGKAQSQINALVGGSIFQTTWNANTNTPTLVSSSGSKGNYYIVDVSGSTNLDGISDWKVGDWAIYDGDVWRKVDNTDAVSSVNGFTGAVSLVTTNILEGDNLYHTNSRAINSTLTGYVSGSGTIASSDTILSAIQKLSGNIGILVTGVSSVFGRTGTITAQSGDYTTNLVIESGSLYYTDERVDDRVSALIQNGIGVSWSYSDVSNTLTGDVNLTPFTTSDLIEGSNLYYTNSRSRASISSSIESLTYNSGSGVFSLTSGYSIPLTSSQYNWDVAYSNIINSLTTSGSFGTASLVSNVLNIPTYTLFGLGGVPYTGATANVDLGTYTLSSGNVNSSGNFISSKSSLATWGISNASSSAVYGGFNGSSITGGYFQLFGASSAGSGITPAGGGEFVINSSVSSTTKFNILNYNGSSYSTLFSINTSGTAIFNNLASGIIKSTSGTLSAATASVDYIAGNVGTANYIPIFSGSGVLGNSSMYENGQSLDNNGIFRVMSGNYAVASSGKGLELTYYSPDDYGAISSYHRGVGYKNLRFNGSSIILALSGVVKATFVENGLLLNTTTDLGYRLDVNGTGRFTNTLYITGSIFSSGSIISDGNLFVTGSGNYTSLVSASDFYYQNTSVSQSINNRIKYADVLPTNGIELSSNNQRIIFRDGSNLYGFVDYYLVANESQKYIQQQLSIEDYLLYSELYQKPSYVRNVITDGTTTSGLYITGSNTNITNNYAQLVGGTSSLYVGTLGVRMTGIKNNTVGTYNILVSSGSDYTIGALQSIPNSVLSNSSIAFVTSSANGLIITGSSVTLGATMSLNLVQDINTTASPTFNNLSLTGNVTVGGDVTVNGTVTQINSTQVEIGDNIILLNKVSNVADAGIYILDATSTTGTGSLLWDATNNYWKGGWKDSEYRMSQFSGSMVTNSFVSINSSGYMISNTSPTTIGDIYQWGGSEWSVSNIIDGGSY